MKKFSKREETIEFLVKETEIPKEECTFVYDFLLKLYLDK